jgi:polysaccharide deacetylase 2 family uncharacterized protein YibQ
MAQKQLPAKRGRSRGRRKGNRFERTLGIGIVIAALAIALILWGPMRRYRVGGERKAAPQAKRVEVEKAVPVAVVIDDLGQDLKAAKEILSLPARITYAVMPGLLHSREIAELARRDGREVLLHLPMQPKDKGLKASPGALSSNMTPMNFVATIGTDLDSVPGAVGVNNHEGSALTENAEAMKFLMAELKERNLFFIDSFTSPKSTAYATAREFGLKAARRDVFLDNESDNEEYVGRQLDELTRFAKERGRAVGIGHPHPATINALRKWLKTISQKGIEIVPASRIVN